MQLQVGARNTARRPLRPFDQRNGSFVKILVHSRIEKFLWRLEAIKIKVI